MPSPLRRRRLRPLAVALAAALAGSGALCQQRDGAAAKPRRPAVAKASHGTAPQTATAAGALTAGSAAVVASGGSAGGAAGGASTAPSGGPLAQPAGSTVFFTVEGNPERGPLTLIPLQCYDAAKKARLAGDACLQLLPAGATVQTSGGPLQLGEAAAPQCPRQPVMGGLRLRGKAKAVPLLYGAWPSLQAVRYIQVPEKSLGGAMASVEKLMRRAIVAATSLLVADLSIYQIIALPLRGESPLQKVYSVAVPDRRGRTRWSGLLIGDVNGKQAAVAGADELPGVKQHSMQIVGSMDIDHDGMLELLVNSGGQNLDRYSVRAYDGEKLEVVSYWHSCGD